MTAKEFLRPTLGKIIVMLLIIFLVGQFFQLLVEGPDSPAYSFYFPLPVIKNGCGFASPGTSCGQGFQFNNLIINLIILIIVYIFLLLVIKNKKLKTKK